MHCGSFHPFQEFPLSGKHSFSPFSGTLEAVQAANCPTQYAFFTRRPVTSSPALICSYMDMLCIAWAAKCIIYAQSASTRLLHFFFFLFNCKQKSTPAVNAQLDSSARRAGQEKHKSLEDVGPQIETVGERKVEKWRAERRRWQRRTHASGVDMLIAPVQQQEQKRWEKE